MILYNLFIGLLNIGIQISAIQNKKNKAWIKGRENWKKDLTSEKDNFKNVIWIHAASYGEFEQGKPIIDKLKDEQGEGKILVTFFSPSGFEGFKNYKNADWVKYLPLDTYSNMEFFVDTVKPKKVVFIKYEFWFNLLSILQTKKIPHFFVSSIFRDSQLYFKPWAKPLLNILKKVDHFFIQNKESGLILKNNGINQYTITGDTRFDTVIENRLQNKSIDFLDSLKPDVKTFICGSTWPEDEELIIKFINKYPEFNYIIAPHEIKPKNISNLQSQLKQQSIKVSDKSTKTSNIIIIDEIGHLKFAYKYADLAFIGGGFNKSGIHNSIEAAVFEIPVVFGPNYQKFDEAKTLINLGAAISIDNFDSLEESFLNVNDEEKLEKVKIILQKYLSENSGATKKILSLI